MGDLPMLGIGDRVRVMQTPKMEADGHANKRGYIVRAYHRSNTANVEVDGTNEILVVPLSSLMKLENPR